VKTLFSLIGLGFAIIAIEGPGGTVMVLGYLLAGIFWSLVALKLIFPEETPPSSWQEEEEADD